MHQVEDLKDRLARTMAIAGLVVAIAGLFISMVTFYFSFWKPPCLRVSLGPQVYIASKPRVGVLATLVNAGASEIIIASGELKLDEGQFTLPLTTTAIQTESWEYDDEGN